MTISGLFLNADIIVQCVVVLLVLASFWSWAIIFGKLIAPAPPARSRAKQFEESFWSGGSLEDLFDRIGERPPDPMASVFVAAMREWRRSAAKGLLTSTEFKAGLKERIERVMDITLGREMEQLERYMVYPGLGRLVGAVRRAVRHGLGHHEQLRRHRRLEEHQPGRGGARHRRGAVRDRARPGRRDPGGARLQQALRRSSAATAERLEAFAGEFDAILSRQLEERR